MKSAYALISTSALAHNIAVLRKQAPQSKLMAMVKANAYGHGMLDIASNLENVVDAFGVARVEEAIALRRSGIKAQIVLLEGFCTDSNIASLAADNIATVIHCEHQLLALEQAKLSKPMNVWIKIDTGMHRLGFTPDQFAQLKARIFRNQNIAKPLGIMTHFASADEQHGDYTLAQIAGFDSCVSGLEAEQSLANSAGIFAFEQSHRDWIRPGISVYGVSPFDHLSAEQLGLQPVMELRSSLIAVRPHKAGESAGYGRIWHSDKDTYLGVVAIGYGDGYPRTAPQGTPVRINGRIVPIVGRVSMDMLTVDLGPKPMDQVGDEAIIWGAGLPVEKVAKHVGTIAYELVTKLTARVPLNYKD